MILTNLLFLLGISLVPFPTSLLAGYLGQPEQQLANTIYLSVSVLIAIFFILLWGWSSHKNRLLDPDPGPALIHALNHGDPPGAYLVALALGFIHPTASLLVNLAMAALFAPTSSFMIKLQLCWLRKNQ